MPPTSSLRLLRLRGQGPSGGSNQGPGGGCGHCLLIIIIHYYTSVRGEGMERGRGEREEGEGMARVSFVLL